MDWFNFVVAGSGPGGVAAARRLEGKGTCIVDIGITPEQVFPHASLGEGLASGDIESMLGSHWEMLTNLVEPGRVHPKLRAPGVRYVASGQAFRVHDASGESYLRGAGSHAAGGMSNAWGAQLFRYNDADFAEAGDWPINADALETHYADIEAHIGIAGEVDDMYGFLGETTCMLPPTPIVPAADYLLARYRKCRSYANLCLGRSRLAILTKPYRGYPEHGFNETEFFSTEQLGLYTARRTLDELRDGGRLTYLGGYELVAYREYPEFVEIDLRQCDSNAVRMIRTKHLLLGCGTLQTARLVLLNKQAVGRSLPFIDHPPTLAPLFIPRMFGTTLPARSFPVQLVATINLPAQRDMISFYYPGALLWSDLLADMPLPMDAALKLLPNLLGGMLVAQIWETSRPALENRLSLTTNGSIRIDYPRRSPYARLNSLLTALRLLGVYSLPRLATLAPPGWGFHYAGCLPMRHRPTSFETHTDGRLWDSQRVRAIDGSVLPSLPAKNHSLTLMANAARIADETLRCEY
jgi:choline dehydrogenase-like flavoprotein